MKNYSTKDIRNIALLGHSSSGKSTLAESIFCTVGLVDRMGKNANGTLFSDFDSEEKKRNASVSLSTVAVEYNDCKLNLLDAPGSFDFIGGVCEAISATDFALIVLSGKSGLNSGAKTALEFCENEGVPFGFYIGKLDSSSAAYNKVLSSLTGVYGAKICPVTIPVYDSNTVVGYADIINKKAYSYTDGKASTSEFPDNEFTENLLNVLIENVASQDEVLMEKYFEGEQLSADEIISAMKSAISNGDIIPVFAGCQQLCEGTDLLIDLTKSILPSPKAEEGNTKAFVYKTVSDPYVGKMNYIKVLSGVIKADTKLIDSNTGDEIKISKISCPVGAKQVDVAEVVAGDICVISKLNDVKTGDALYTAGDNAESVDIKYPKPVFSMAVVTVKKGDEEKAASALLKLCDEDPTLVFKLDKETGQQIISGQGETHLDCVVSKLKDKYGVEIKLQKPDFAYRETIRKSVKVQGKYKKQSGGHGQYGDVWIEFEPSDTDEFKFEEKIFGGAVPKNFFPAVEKGLKDSVEKGMLAGYPVIGLKATLVDGSYHPVDSSEMSFKTAASLAFKEAMPKADAVLLEPVGTLTVTIKDDFMGDVIGDINKRRGRVLGMDPVEKGMSQVTAEVPIGEMHDFSTSMRSITQSRAIFTLEFVRYEEMPMNLAQKIMEKNNKE